MIDAHERQCLHVVTGQRLSRQAIDLLQERPVRIGKIHLQIKRPLTAVHKTPRLLKVICHAFAAEVRGADRLEIKRERLLRIHVQLANDARAVARLPKRGHDVGRCFGIHRVLPRRQTDLPVLVRIQPGQECRARLRATRLRHVRVSKQRALFRQAIQMRRGDRRAIAAHLRPVILGDNEQNIRWRRLRQGSQQPQCTSCHDAFKKTHFWEFFGVQVYVW